MAAGDPRAPADAPHGTGAQLRRLAGTVDAGRAPQPVQTDATARTVAPAPVRGPGADQVPDEDVSGGYDEALFGPTWRPDEPITHGAPFGPGRSFVVMPYEDRRSFELRVADQIEASDQGGALSAYITKLRAGG